MAIQNNTPFVRHVGGTEGTTGWSRTDVLSAIEQVLSDAGVHGSSERKGGVVVNCLAPGGDAPYNNGGWNDVDWKKTGGGQVKMPYQAYHHIRLSVNGGAFVANPIWQPNVIYTNGEIFCNRMGSEWQDYTTNTTNGIDLAQVSGLKHICAGYGYVTGQEVIVRNPSSGGTLPPELTVGQTYYMIIPDDYTDITAQTQYPDTFKLAASLADAQAGNAITFASQWSGNTATYNDDINIYHLEFEFPAVTKISANQEDYITFHLTNTAGHPIVFVDTDDTSLTFPGGTYSDVRQLKETNNTTFTHYANLSYRDMPAGDVELDVSSGLIYWYMRNWTQGTYVLQCKNHSAMQLDIEVKPNTRTYTTTYNQPYWDYEVPASGGREACTFRVYRRTYEENSNEYGKIAGIRVETPDAKGWSADEVFTIPGDKTGGSTPAHDIVFGVNSATTQQIADLNAVPSVQVMDIGSGSTNFYARYNQVNAAIVEIENDANKTYGTTYYGIKLKSDDHYQLQIGAGVGWNYLNWNPTSTWDTYEGSWKGQSGFDIAVDQRTFAYNDSHYAEFQYGVGSNANSYPLKVQVWKANANDPQDPNFYILQFVQNVAGNDESQLSLYFHKGTVIGNGIWDLDHVWQGGFTSFRPGMYASVEEIITFETHMAKNYRGTEEQLGENKALRRCAEYGYFRDAESDSTSAMSHSTYFSTNIYTNNVESDTIKPYFRDSAFDKRVDTKNYKGDKAEVDVDYRGGQIGISTGGNYDYQNSPDYYPGNKSDIPSQTAIDAAADYYKPIKGLPLQNGWAPVPYYLPDDWVVIPFNVTPGATTFHTGDNIEVSASEIYKIIEVSYTINQKTFDGISQNSCKGIAFCARTT